MGKVKSLIRNVKRKSQSSTLTEMILFDAEPTAREPWVTLAFAIATIFSATFRGLDYFFLPQKYGVLTVIEEAAPIKLWGVGFLVGALHCALGRIIKRYSVVIIGHTILASLYFSLGVGYIEQGSHDISTDYLRNGVTFILVVSGAHWVYAYAMWRRWDNERRLKA